MLLIPFILMIPWVDISFYDNLYQNGNYVSRNLLPITGKEYKVIAKVPGMPEASSITTIPDLVRIEHVDTSRIIGADQKLIMYPMYV